MKTCVIYHSIDLDGWMSAAIVKYWFITNAVKNLLNINISNPNTIDFIGYNYGQPIPDLSEYNQIIMCDISFSKEEMLKLYERLNSNFIWIDHHISAIKDNVLFNLEKGGNYHIDYYGIRDIEFAACELTWQYFFPNEPMPEIVRLLGRYDCFGHKGTDEEQKVLMFQYGARQCISDYEGAYKNLIYNLKEKDSYEILDVDYKESIYKNGKSIYQYLCTEAKQTYKNGFEIILEEFVPYKVAENHFNESYIAKRKFICINKERFNPINFGIDYHKDGYDGCACFHYADGVWNFSLYNDNGEVDCSSIAKQFGGGGHKGASGFRISDIREILGNV